MSSQKRSLNRPTIKIRTKKQKIGINLRKKTKEKKRNPTTGVATSSLSTSSSSTSLQGTPSILTKQYKTNIDPSLAPTPTPTSTTNDNLCNQEDEYSNDAIFNEMFNKFIEETDDVHDIIIAMQSLIKRHSAAVCTMMSHNQSNNYIPFLLKPMIRHVLNSKSATSTLSKKDSNKNDKIASANLSTGFNIDLENLDVENKIRLIQLHGMTDADDGNSSNDDENIAILFMEDYINGVHDAASAAVEQTNTNQNDELEMQSFHQRNQMIITLFLDCLHNHGCNGRFVSTTKLQNSLKSAWIKYKEINTENKTSQASSSCIESISGSRSALMHFQPEKWIEHLVQMQLLLPRVLNSSQTSCTTSYWYTLPKMGITANAIMEGRKRMMNKIKRSYNKEIRRNILEQINMVIGKRNGTNSRNLSSMTGFFHVRDLLARDIVRLVYRPSGEFIRLK